MEKWHCYATRGDWGEKKSKEHITWSEMVKFIKTRKNQGYDYFEINRSYRVD